MKKFLALTTFFILLGVITGFAQKPCFAESLPETKWKMGLEIYQFKYEEPDVMEENGIMRGICISYVNHDTWMSKFEFRYSSGQVDYENSGTMKDINDYTYELRLIGGYDNSIFSKSTLTPYFGIAYRYLNDDMDGKSGSTGAAGYERESNYFYSPLGIEFTTPLGSSWSFEAVIEYDIFWFGKQISHLSDVDPGYNDLKNKQKAGYGARGSVILEKKGRNIDVVIEPFIRYWNIKKSKNDDIYYNGAYWGYGWEPKNNTTEIGIIISCKF